MAISITTLNVNGLRDANKRMGFIELLLCFNYDVLCLQETHISSYTECSAWLSAAGYDCLISPGSNRSRGSVILYSSSFSLQKQWSDTEGRLSWAEFAIRELSFRVLCVYAPNRVSARNDFLEACVDVVEPGIPTFVLGDFNTVFDRSMDRRGSDPLDDSHESSLALREFFAKCCVVDIWRDLHPLTPGFTCESTDRARASRIDFIGCPAVWAPFVSFCNFVPYPFSDQSVVHLSISPPVANPTRTGQVEMQHFHFRVSGAEVWNWIILDILENQAALLPVSWKVVG